MILTDKNLTIITGICLAAGVGLAGVFMQKNDTLAGIAQATAAPLPLSQPLIPQTPGPDYRLASASGPDQQELPTPRSVLQPPPVLDCTPKATATPILAAQVVLTVNAPCLGASKITIHHAGLSFSEKLSSWGKLTVTVPAFAENARFDIDLQGGRQITAFARVSGLERIKRIGISWQGPRTVDLQSLGPRQFMLSRQRPGTVYQAMMDGGGYLAVLGNPEGPETERMQVVTYFPPAGGGVSVVDLVVKTTDCRGDFQLNTARTQQGNMQTLRRLHLTLPDCVNGSVKTGLKTPLESLTIARK